MIDSTDTLTVINSEQSVVIVYFLNFVTDNYDAY